MAKDQERAGRPASARGGAYLRQLAATIAAEGVWSAFAKSLQELQLYRRLVLINVSLMPTTPRPIAGAVVEARRLIATPDDLRAYGALRPDTPVTLIESRLAAGDLCFGAWLDGRLASTVWAVRDRAAIDYLECEIVLRAGDVYIYDLFTLPELRGRDLASWRMEALKARLRDDGVERALAGHVPENRNQSRRTERRSHRALALVGWIGVGRWRRLFVRPAGADVAPERLPELRWPTARARAPESGRAINPSSGA